MNTRYFLRRLVAGFSVIVLVLAYTNQASASIVALVYGNDTEALNYMNNALGVTGLTLLAKDNDPDLGSSVDAGIVADANWNISVDATNRTGTWTITDSSVVSEYFFVKSDGFVAIYDYMGPGASPWQDSYDSNADIWNAGTDDLLTNLYDENGNLLLDAATVGASSNGNGKYNIVVNGQNKNINASAATSHASVYGSLSQVPEPMSLAIWSVLALGCAGVYGRRRRRHR